MRSLLTLEGTRVPGRAWESGFSLIELMFVAAIVGVLFIMTIPMIMSAASSFKLSGAARGIAAQLALARLRAAASFTQAQLNVTNSTAGTYELDLCTTKNTATGACTTFTQDPNTGTQYLPSGITFAFPSTFAQPGSSGQTGAYQQTYQIVFNSRGIPISGSPPTPTGSDALYLTNGAGQYYAITVYASGKVTLFRWQSSSSTWQEM
jgi:prepilin-type N-terminal cleavage/methylation domain-containing protein